MRARLALLGFVVVTLVAATVTFGRPLVQERTKPARPNVTGLIGFDFKDPKGVNAISFFVDSELEPIMGWISGITGTMRFDPEKPERLLGSVSFGPERINCTNRRMTRVLFGADWLGIDTFGHVGLSIDKTTLVERIDEHKSRLSASGRINLHGIEKPLVVELTATHVPGGAARRGGGSDIGDLLVLRSEFTIDRTEFGLGSAEGPFEKVGREIEIKVAIVGYSE